MKEVFDDILNKHEVPVTVKNRLMESAKIYLLAKDLGGLFLNKFPKASKDIIKTVVDSKKLNTGEKKEH